jgi:3-hydroxyacyl-[acyl-carrier-protein] dehydratase
MRYLLIDRIERFERRRRLVAVKNVTASEDFFADHFIGQPVMPGALLIESLAQAGTALLEISDDIQRKALLILVERAKFRVLVRPGDHLLLNVMIESWTGDLARVDGSITVKDRPVAEAKLVFALRSVEEFYPASVRGFVEMAYHNLLMNAITVTEGTENP